MQLSITVVFLQGKDVRRILGVSKNTATRIMNNVRLAYGKTDRQSVTLDELCHYEQLDPQWVYARFF